ncbi:MAG: ParA family protein, partial [Myxococcota bacterium]
MTIKETLGSFRKMLQKPKLPTGDRQAKVVAVTAQKGGVGKTTTAVHIAAGLAMFHSCRVLLLDMDAQAHVGMSLLQRLPEQEGTQLGPLLLEKQRDIQEIAQASAIEDLWIIPSDRQLNQTETQLASRIGKELRLKQSSHIARTYYDVIVIDCPPNTGTLTINALAAADYVLIPCDMSILSLDGVESILETLSTVQEMLNPQLQWLGIVRTKVDRRNMSLNRSIV